MNQFEQNNCGKKMKIKIFGGFLFALAIVGVAVYGEIFSSFNYSC